MASKNLVKDNHMLSDNTIVKDHIFMGNYARKEEG